MTNASSIRLIPDCRVSAGGKKLDLGNDAALVRVVVDLDVDLFGRCTLEFHDPRLALINGSGFNAGTRIKVELGFGSKLQTVFEGEVVGLEPQFRRDVPPSLQVVCYETLHRLALSQMTRTFNDVDDKQIATKIAREHGLTAQAPSGTKEHILQSNLTDATFLRRLAQKHGNHLRIEGKKLIVGPPPRLSDITIVPGEGLKKMRVRLKSLQQVSEISVHGWDPKAKREIVGKAKPKGESGKGAREHGAGTLSLAGHEQQPADVASAEAMAQGRLRKLAEGFSTASVQMIGNPGVRPGAMLLFDKLGAKLEGKYRVDKARHEFSKHGYLVTFEAVRVGKKPAEKVPGPSKVAAAAQQRKEEPGAKDAPGLKASWSKPRAAPGDKLELNAAGPKAKGTVLFDVFEVSHDGRKNKVAQLSATAGKEHASARWTVPPLDHLHDLPKEGENSVKKAPVYEFAAKGSGATATSAKLDLGYDLEWDFKHEDGKPLGSEGYVVHCADGSTRRGKLSKGHLSVLVPVGHVHVELEGFDHLDLDAGKAEAVPHHESLCNARWSAPQARPGEAIQLSVEGAAGKVKYEIHEVYEDGTDAIAATLEGGAGLAWTVPPLDHLHELPVEGGQPHRCPQFYFVAQADHSKARSPVLGVGYQLEWDFKTPEGVPLSNEGYRLHCADGSLRSGFLRDGHLSAWVPAGHVSVEVEGHDEHPGLGDDAPTPPAARDPLRALGELFQQGAAAVEQGKALFQQGAAVVQEGLAVAREVTQVIGEVREIREEVVNAVDQLQHPGKSMWPNLDWPTLEAQAKSRGLAPRVGPPAVRPVRPGECTVVTGPSLIQQQDRGVCGPTSVLHAFASWDPQGYLRWVKDVFETGRVFGKLVTDWARNGTPRVMTTFPDGSKGLYGMPDVDFMTLIALTSTKHDVLDWNGARGEGLQTLALPEEVAGWMHKLLGCVETKILTTLPDDLATAKGAFGAISRVFSGGPLAVQTDEAARQVSGLLAAHPAEVTVTMCIAGYELVYGEKGTLPPYPDHYVRLLSPIQFGPGAQREVHLHSWGSEWKVRFDERWPLEKLVFFFVVGSRTPGLLASLTGTTLPDLGLHV